MSEIAIIFLLYLQSGIYYFFNLYNTSLYYTLLYTVPFSSLYCSLYISISILLLEQYKTFFKKRFWWSEEAIYGNLRSKLKATQRTIVHIELQQLHIRVRTCSLFLTSAHPPKVYLLDFIHWFAHFIETFQVRLITLPTRIKKWRKIYTS